jgi:glutaredoxin
MMKKVSIISRTGCHLCEIAIDQVNSVKNELNFELEIKLIDESIELEELYGEQVPVIMINEKIHDYWRVDLARFRAAIKS